MKKKRKEKNKAECVESAPRSKKTKVASIHLIMTLEFFVKVSTTMMGSYLVKGKNQFEGFSTLTRVLDVRIPIIIFVISNSLSLFLSPFNSL